MGKRSSSHCLLSIYYVSRPEPWVGQEASGSQGYLCQLGSNRTAKAALGWGMERVTELCSTGRDT